MKGFNFVRVLIIISASINVLCSTNDGKINKSFISRRSSLRHLVTQEKSTFAYRNNNHDITRKCESSEPTSVKLTVTYNEPSGLSVTVNDTSNTAYLIDYKAILGLLLNGQNGVGILIDYNSSTAYKLDKVWTASKEPINKFFQNVTSLKPLLEKAKQKGGGTPLAKPSKAIEGEIAQDISHLAGSYQPKDIENYFGKTFITHLRPYRKVFYTGTGSFEVNRVSRTQAKLELALAQWLAAADDIDAIGTLDVGRIFSAKTGLGTFLNFFEQINERADLAKVFKTLLTSQKFKFFSLVSEVEKAMSYEGIDGFDIVLTDFILLLSGKGSLKETFNDLLKYTPNDDLKPDVLRCYLDRIEAIVRTSIEKYKNRDVLGWAYDFVTTKIAGKLVIFNVNISDLANLLTARNLGQIIKLGVKVLADLLSPQNIPSIVQWLQAKDDV